jgi:hypothetical protein
MSQTSLLTFMWIATISPRSLVEPVGLALNLGFSPVELRRIQEMLKENENDLMEKWNARFRKLSRGNV